MSIASGLAYVLSQGQTIAIPTEAGVLGDRSFLFGLPNFALVAIILVIVVDVFLRWTVPGRLIYSIGSNIEAAKVAGIRVEGVRLMAYGISGTLALSRVSASRASYSPGKDHWAHQRPSTASPLRSLAEPLCWAASAVQEEPYSAFSSSVSSRTD